LRAFFEDSIDITAISHLLTHQPVIIESNLPPVSVQESNDREPILIGHRFVLVPACRIVLPIDAAMAFGSGRHESTQLCLEAMELYVQPGQTVLDVGCGSGILALAALKLGAKTVIGADIDEPALAVARRHFPGALVAGSSDCFATSSADIVLCNITGSVNDRLARQLKRIVRPGGLVIISGFTTLMAPQCFKPAHTLSLDDWECWICHPHDITPLSDDAEENQHKPQWWL
jgi:ribosomal protein L11 methyltransferase